MSPIAAADKTYLLPPSGRFSAREISVVIRLLQQLQFVDPLKNSVDRQRNDFAV